MTYLVEIKYITFNLYHGSHQLTLPAFQLLLNLMTLQKPISV